MAGARIVFVARHGERIDHVDRTWPEQAENPDDPFLTERGIRQAQALGGRLVNSNLTHIFTSPFYRTVQTAAEVAKATGLSLKVEPGLSEMLNPNWFSENPRLKAIKELKKEFPMINEEHEPQLIPTYPETREELISRAAAIGQALAEKFSGNILLVSHGIMCEFVVRGITDTGPRPYVSYCALQCCKRNNETGKFFIDGKDEPDISFMPEDIRPVVKTGYR